MAHKSYQKQSLHRRAQVALFLIVAIILLVGVLLLFSFLTTKTRDKISPESERKTPLEAVPIKNFYDGCVLSTAKEAFEKLGLHGGYIDPYDSELSLRGLNLKSAETAPTDSDGIVFSEPIVYWHYMDSPNVCRTCTLSTKNIPGIEDIEMQVNLYVGKNLDKCLAKFVVFKEQGFSVVQGEERIIDTTITDKDVLIEISEKLEITKDNSKTTINTHLVSMGFNFRKIYILAMNLTQAESQGSLLEGLFMKLIGSYGAINSEIPPIADSSYGYEYKTWMKPVVKERIQELLQVNVPYIQIANTKGAAKAWEDSKTGYEEKFLKSLYWEFFSDRDDLKETSVSFLYFNWPMYFNVHPSSGDLLMPNVYRFDNAFGSSSQFNHYEFFYHASFPVVVMLRDEDAPFPDGYKFLFGLEANVRCNKDMQSWSRGDINDITVCPWPEPSLLALEKGAPISVNTETGETIVSNGANARTSKSLMCDPEQKLGAKVSFRSFDAWTRESLPGVIVAYGCGKYKECPMSGSAIMNGTIALRSSGIANENSGIANENSGIASESSGIAGYIGKAVFSDTLPICMGDGYLKVFKAGYKDMVFDLESLQGRTVDLGDIYLEKETEVAVGLKILDMNAADAGQSLSKNSARTLLSSEEAIITLTREKENSREKDYVRAVRFAPGTANAENKILLVSGKYSISVILIDNIGYRISAGCKCYCASYNDRGECTRTDCIPKEDIVSVPSTPGGVSLDKVPLKFDKNSKTLLIYGLKTKTPQCLDDLKEQNRVAEYSSTYRFQLSPEVLNVAE